MAELGPAERLNANTRADINQNRMGSMIPSRSLDKGGKTQGMRDVLAIRSEKVSTQA